jgi:hypothetical protein
MAIRYNAPTLEKIERLITESGYVLRYERGNFQSGYCLLEARKVVVINKFLQVEGRIHTLIDLLPVLSVDPFLLSPEARSLYVELMGRFEEQDSQV